MSNVYGEHHRALQDQFDTRRLADLLEGGFIAKEVDDGNKAFIESRDMFFLTTIDTHGQPTVSYKGGDPGFVRVLDGRTIAFPVYDGNGMYLTAGNALVNPHVGLLFIDFENRRRMRLNGIASVADDDPLLAEYPEAQLVVRVAASEVFPNCPRYIHEYTLVQRSRFVPREDCATPAPAWKTRDWAHDVLREDDPANEPGAEIIER